MELSKVKVVVIFFFLYFVFIWELMFKFVDNLWFLLEFFLFSEFRLFKWFCEDKLDIWLLIELVEINVGVFVERSDDDEDEVLVFGDKEFEE